ncbi:MAG: hypothetical protein L0229_11365 [Blastocatellia bacterium]|nr:hypothetical protein [Blastocatellia bacterium]
MKRVQPRALVHRGFVDASAFLLDPGLIGLEEARRRILSLWVPGARVYRVDDLLIVRLPDPHHIACDRAPGLPLVASGQALLAAPFAANELEAIAAPHDSIVLVRGGAAIAHQLSDSQIENPESWLEVDLFEIAETASLGARPAGPRVVAEPEPFDARARMKGVPPEAQEAREIFSSIRREEAQTETAAAGAEINRAIRVRIAKSLEKLASFFERKWRKVGQKSRGATVARTHSGRLPVTQSEPSFAEAFSARMRRLAARLLLKTRLAGVIGRRQSQYFMRLIDMFESGNLDEALRHAIPLGGLAESKLFSPSFGVPGPRAGLTISPTETRSRSSIVVGDDLMSEIRQLYRSSFERLEAQGRIEEAAFVLAELLHSNEEAVAFLERHGRLRLAAEMAEARGLPPGLIVRQWFLAGDRERAIHIARRTKSFADAVIRLERTDKKQAEVLRLLWAASLADAGDYVAAVEAAWPVEGARTLALTWMEKAIEIGGAGGARMLARKLALVPESFPDIRLSALALLEDGSPENAPARMAFADTLSREEKTAQSKTLARAAARACLRDANLSPARTPSSLLRRLIEFSGDASLRADAPVSSGSPERPLHSRSDALQVELSASDVGILPVSDLAYLPDGRVVVALGEAGARLLARDGRTLAHFDQPAHRLVISDHGDRAIALAPRGEVWKLARIDFLSRKAEEWCEARIDNFASDYDGSLWFMGAKRDFYIIDATARRFDALWRVPDLYPEDSIFCVARSQSSCRILTFDRGAEEWHYELPLMKLRSRNPVRFPENSLMASTRLAISAEGLIADQSVYYEMDQEGHINSQEGQVGVNPPKLTPLRLRIFRPQESLWEIVIGDENCKPGIPAIMGDWVAAPVSDETGARVLLVDAMQGRVLLKLSLIASERVAVRLSRDTLSVADERGRIYVFGIDSGRVLRDMRI